MRDIERYQADYQSAYGFERHMVRLRRRQVLECMARYPHRRILEVGCGLEPLFEHVEQWDSWDIVEPGGQFAEHARQRVPAGRVVAIHQGFLEDVASHLEGRSFDFIVASSLLHEVEDPRRLLALLRRLCEPQTVLHLNVPNARSLHVRLALHMGLIPDLLAPSPLAERMQRTGTYDQGRLRALVEEMGLHVESSGSYFLKPFTHAQLQQMLESAIISEGVLDALYAVNAEFRDAGAEIFVNVRRR